MVRRVGPLLGLVDEGVERVRDVRLLLRGGRFASSLAIDSDAACGSICVLVFCTQSGHSASTSLAKARSFLSLRRSDIRWASPLLRLATWHLAHRPGYATSPILLVLVMLLQGEVL